MRYLYLPLFWIAFFACRSSHHRNDLSSERNPDWKLTYLSNSWSLYVPPGADIIIRGSNLIVEPDEIIFPFDSLRIEFRTDSLGYEPETTNFNKIARSVIEDPTLGLCQGDSDNTADNFSPLIDYSRELSGYRYQDQNSVHVYLRQMKAKQLLALHFDCISDKNISIVDSIIRTIEFRRSQ